MQISKSPNWQKKCTTLLSERFSDLQNVKKKYHSVASNGKIIRNYELEKCGRKHPGQILLEELRNLSQYSQFLVSNINTVSADYEGIVLITVPQYSINYYRITHNNNPVKRSWWTKSL
jgi:hypothetical protein